MTETIESLQRQLAEAKEALMLETHAANEQHDRAMQAHHECGQAQAQIVDMEFKLYQCFSLKPENWQMAIIEITKTQSALIQAQREVAALRRYGAALITELEDCEASPLASGEKRWEVVALTPLRRAKTGMNDALIKTQATAEAYEARIRADERENAVGCLGTYIARNKAFTVEMARDIAALINPAGAAPQPAQQNQNHIVDVNEMVETADTTQGEG